MPICHVQNIDVHVYTLQAVGKDRHRWSMLRLPQTPHLKQTWGRNGLVFGLLEQVETCNCLESIKEELALYHSVLKNTDMVRKLRGNWVKRTFTEELLTSSEFYGESIRT